MLVKHSQGVSVGSNMFEQEYSWCELTDLKVLDTLNLHL